MKNDKVLPFQKFTTDFYKQFRSKDEKHLDKLWQIHNSNECDADCPYDHDEGENDGRQI